MIQKGDWGQRNCDPNSEAPGDAIVTLNAGECSAQDTATVVQVQLDKFCYNRADPFPDRLGTETGKQFMAG